MLPLGVCPQECPVCVLQLWALPCFTSCMLPQAQARASQEVPPAVLWAWDGFNQLIERPLETEAQGGLISVPVEPASSPGLQPSPALGSVSCSFPGLAGGSLPYQSHQAASGPR